jgi:hypothetical protein
MSKISIKGADTGTGVFTLESPATNTDRTLTIPDVDGSIVTADASGNVGIGTNSPTQAGLVVNTIGNPSTSARLALKSNETATDTYLRFARYGSGVDSAFTIGNNYNRDSGFAADYSSYGVTNIQFSDGYLTFGTGAAGESSPTERARIDSSGNLLVGTTDLGTIGSTTGVALYADGRVMSSNNSNGSYFARTGTDGGIIYFRKNTSTVGNIAVTGSTTTYTTSSDYRLKENVVGVTGAAARVQQLNPVRFNFIADPDKTVDGFLAHEVQDVVPEAITGVKDAVDAEGNPDYQGIDQSKLVPLLTAALQEALARIETLEADVATLKGNV